MESLDETLAKQTPLTRSFDFVSPIPVECMKEGGEAVVLGVDEAGRGPVLGPMVYAAAYIPTSRQDELKALGVDDSKAMTEEARDILFDKIVKNSDWIGFAVTVCSPQDLSESMLRRIKYNLNAIAHDTTIALLNKLTKTHGVNVKEIFVDTVGPPAKYQQVLQTHFSGAKVRVEKKADALFPVVSAASICAKVIRDRILRDWQFVEQGLEVSRAFGSGYPSDPNTCAWMREHCDKIFGFPRLLRFSWSTADRAMEDNGAATVVFNSFVDEEDKKNKRKAEEPVKEKPKTFLHSLNLIPVTSL